MAALGSSIALAASSVCAARRLFRGLDACCGRLLYLLSRNLQLPLDTFLFHPSLEQPGGPVLWAAMIEAASLMPVSIQCSEYEPLLSTALLMPWETVRY